MTKLVQLVLVSAAGILLGTAQAPAPAGAFTLEQVLSYPFPDNLVASPKGSLIAWTFNERGVRNIYVGGGAGISGPAPHRLPARRRAGADEPVVRRLTAGRWCTSAAATTARTGPPRGTCSPTRPAAPCSRTCRSGRSRRAAAPRPRCWGKVIHRRSRPTGDRVAFVKDRRIWIAPLDGSKPAEQAFFARGTSEAPAWSPDGRALAFVSDRDDHGFIGIFTDASQPIRYLAAVHVARREPAVVRVTGARSRSSGSRAAAARRSRPSSSRRSPGRSWSRTARGSRRSGIARASTSWKSGGSLVDSVPRTAGGANLHWAAGDRIAFLSYHDGWPHLYSIQHPDKGGTPTLLTPGAFMVEHVSLTPDRRFLVYSANTGADRHDIDRRHLFKVPVDGSAPPTPLTSGTGLEWSPVVTGDGADGGVPRIDGAAAAAAGGDADRGRPAAARWLRARCRRDSRRRQLVTPEPVTFRSSDGLRDPRAVVQGAWRRGTPAGARLRARRTAAADAARLSLHGLLRQRLRGEPVPRQPRVHRPVGQLSPRASATATRFTTRSKAGARGASEYLDVIAGGRYLQARPDVDAAAHRHLGRIVRRLPRRRSRWGGTPTSSPRAWTSTACTIASRRSAPNSSRTPSSATASPRPTTGRRSRWRIESSPISSVATWTSPVLLIHARRRPQRAVSSDRGSEAAASGEGRERRGGRHSGRHPRLSALAKLANGHDGDRRVFREAIHGPRGRLKPSLTIRLSFP